MGGNSLSKEEVQRMVEESRRSEEQKYDKQLKKMRKRLEEQHEQLAKRQTDLEEKQNEANAREKQLQANVMEMISALTKNVNKLMESQANSQQVQAVQVKKIDEGFREVQDRMATKTTLVRLLDERLPPHSTMGPDESGVATPSPADYTSPEKDQATSDGGACGGWQDSMQPTKQRSCQTQNLRERMNHPPDEVHVKRIHTYQVSETPSTTGNSAGVASRGQQPNHTALLATLGVDHAGTNHDQSGSWMVTAGQANRLVDGDIVAHRTEHTSIEARWRADKPPTN